MSLPVLHELKHSLFAPSMYGLLDYFSLASTQALYFLFRLETFNGIS